MSLDDKLIDRFGALFIGNDRSFGNFDPNNQRMWTTKSNYEREHIISHLDGIHGVGMVPILDDGTCRFAAIDIDAHEEGDFIDLEALEQDVREQELPLVVCRSKSAGAHCYVFFNEEAPCNTVRSILAKWAQDLGYPGVEVFPKQSRLLLDNTGDRALGNWINLPYFNALETDRYAIEGGKQVPFEYFIELAESRRIGINELQNRYNLEHPEAPPCVQSMWTNHVEAGHGVRNRALYAMTVYFKKAFPDDWRDKAFDFNQTRMGEPLAYGEAKKTISSAGRRDYRYKCSEEPCLSLCDRNMCLTRKFGIAQDSKLEGNLPLFTGIRKFMSEPPRWELTVNEKPLFLSSEDLTNFRKIKIAVMEGLHEVIPIIPQRDWDVILARLMQDLELVDVPDEASIPGVMRSKLNEFLRKGDVQNPLDENDTEGRVRVMHGVPVIQRLNGAVYAIFRGTDFQDYLKRTRSEELKGINLWMALRKIGLEHQRMRLGSNIVQNVWCVKLNAEGEIRMIPKEFDLEY